MKVKIVIIGCPNGIDKVREFRLKGVWSERQNKHTHTYTHTHTHIYIYIYIYIYIKWSDVDKRKLVI
jgi:hypothetical protein